jgi:hypothetical protein
LEYLLGKYCASSDEVAIQMGLQVVNDTPVDNYIRPDESARAQSKVKENGRHTFIRYIRRMFGARLVSICQRRLGVALTTAQGRSRSPAGASLSTQSHMGPQKTMCGAPRRLASRDWRASPCRWRRGSGIQSRKQALYRLLAR